jgi:hypothetical protein
MQSEPLLSVTTSACHGSDEHSSIQENPFWRAGYTDTLHTKNLAGKSSKVSFLGEETGGVHYAHR